MPTLNTRIQLKYDTYENFTTNNPVLKAGEVAIATVPTGGSLQQVTPPAVVIKVGDGTSEYNDLPFASALAADVYAWAKKSSLAVSDVPNITTAKVTDFATATDARIDTKINAIDATVNATAGQFITGITQTDGKITAVTSATIPAAPEYTIVAGSTAGTITLEKNGEPVAGATNIKVNGWDALVAEVDEKYVKPASGIPATDLASAVQSNLTAASTAVQTVQFAGTNLTKSGTTASINQTAARTALGLGSAAYTASTAYATAAQGDLADTAVQPEDLGTLASLNTITDAQVSATANIAQSKINGLTSALNSKASTSTVSAMNTRLNTAESDIDELQTKVGDLGNALHFVGAGTYANIPSTGVDGDVYVVTGTSEANSGKEYVWANGAWNEFGDTSDYLLSSTATATYVPLTRTVNGHALSANITLDADDVGAATSADITSAINGLDMAALTVGAGYTINSISQTNGVVSANRVAIAINANQVTAGTFADARIPTLAISKVNGLQTELDSKLEAADLDSLEADVAALETNVANLASNKQAASATLTAIAGLANTAGFVKRTTTGFSVDTNTYQTAAQVNTLINTALNSHAGIDKVGTVTSVSAAANSGLKVTNGTTTPVIDFDANTTFVFYCGTSTELVD